MNLSNYYLIILTIILRYNYNFCQINDNYKSDILEEGNDLVDIKDYHNLSLIITTSKKIYKGIPPRLKVTTGAKIISVTSIITLNENYILAACLQNSLLTKININDGSYSSLVDYTDYKEKHTSFLGVTSYSNILSSAPTESCSLSILDNTVFIGSNKNVETNYWNDYQYGQYNKTMIVFKIQIKDKDSENGPVLDNKESNEYYKFPKSTVLTKSSNQISCEPLRITNDLDNYRLICLFETSESYRTDYFSSKKIEYNVYATSIKNTFDGFENIMNEFKIVNSSDQSGFKIYKLNDTHARCLSKHNLTDISLIKQNTNEIKINGVYVNDDFHSFKADLDLFSYNQGLRFIVQKTSFMNLNNIYSFRINKENANNYYTAYDYKETDITKIMGYYDVNDDYIILFYQTPRNIKYFTITNSERIYNFNSYNKIIQMKSYEHIEYNITDLIEDISNFGNLNVVQITRNLSGLVRSENFGVDFYDPFMDDNILIPEKSFKTWYLYNLSFVEHIKNKYTRIYYLKDVYIIINTCNSFDCISCWNDSNICDVCTIENSLALLSNDSNKCYPINHLVKGYKYNEQKNLFEKCYPSCEFCFASSSNKSDHKCESCAEGYLFSYKYKGNCYKINNLNMNEVKTVSNINSINFIESSSCPLYKIYSTGECVDECPTSDIYFSFDYDSISSNYTRTSIESPKYKFDKICYDKCPSLDLNIDETNKVCKCKQTFHRENGEIKCDNSNNCSYSYPYKNLDTNQCYSSLNECHFYFNNFCYDECPDDKIPLVSQKQAIRNYFVDKLSLNSYLKDKLCICNITNGVWRKSNDSYLNNNYQECLNECPLGYEPESVTNQCVIKKEYNTIKSTIVTTLFKTESIVNTIISTTENVETDKNTIKIDESSYIKDKNSEECKVMYNNKCYSKCPDGTCINQNDPGLKECIIIPPNVKIFNGICFTNMKEITNNLKEMSSNNEVITSESGIILHVYSSSSQTNNEIKVEDKYSIINLGECETKIKEYYKLLETTELYILGIDTPNKNKDSSTSVINFEVYLENGTQLEYAKACEGVEISVSQSITNGDSVNLDEASHFSDLGYDIYNRNSSFYEDLCTPAYIDGNDITLEDRKKYIYPSDMSLCNDSCKYSSVNFTTQRFTCDCKTFSDNNGNNDNNNNNENNVDIEEDESYIDYFLSLINYKIVVCYKFFGDFNNYYKNGGFYISVIIILFCFIEIVIFIIFGMKKINRIIYENTPSKEKLIKIMKEQVKKQNNLKKKNNLLQNPPKNNYLKNYFKEDTESMGKTNNNCIGQDQKINIINNNINYRRRSIVSKSQKIKFKKQFSLKPISQESIKNLVSDESKPKEASDNMNKFNIYLERASSKKYTKNKNNIINNLNEIINRATNDEEVNKKELNNIPFTQALRIDKRNYLEIFFSILAHEIDIVNIFYYKNIYSNLSIAFSIYVFETYLELTLNCILYSEDVVSEKYNNNGSIKFFTSLSLSFISNIISAIISNIVGSLADYGEFIELIIKDAIDKNQYFYNISKFKKYLALKLSGFYLIQTILNALMCYYLVIFCTIYNNTQISILINYIVGVIQSLIYSLVLSLLISLVRFISIKYKWKEMYNTSKFLFEKF